ncbi:MAG: hypothetical protein H7A33_06835 [Deltaproteobacteria bacterium]|nr:hypothetical protein [Deltaproteobacteria bacterium]
MSLKTKTGFSTNVMLTALQNKHELPAKLFGVPCGLAKLQSNLCATDQTLVNENSNRLHTTFNQAVVEATGRLLHRSQFCKISQSAQKTGAVSL